MGAPIRCYQPRLQRLQHALAIAAGRQALCTRRGGAHEVGDNISRGQRLRPARSFPARLVDADKDAYIYYKYIHVNRMYFECQRCNPLLLQNVVSFKVEAGVSLQNTVGMMNLKNLLHVLMPPRSSMSVREGDAGKPRRKFVCVCVCVYLLNCT